MEERLGEDTARSVRQWKHFMTQAFDASVTPGKTEVGCAKTNASNEENRDFVASWLNCLINSINICSADAQQWSIIMNQIKFTISHIAEIKCKLVCYLSKEANRLHQIFTLSQSPIRAAHWHQ